MKTPITPVSECPRRKLADLLNVEIDLGLADLRAGHSHPLNDLREELAARRRAR